MRKTKKRKEDIKKMYRISYKFPKFKDSPDKFIIWNFFSQWKIIPVEKPPAENLSLLPSENVFILLNNKYYAKTMNKFYNLDFPLWLWGRGHVIS